jgi:hypothetical protein
MKDRSPSSQEFMSLNFMLLKYALAAAKQMMIQPWVTGCLIQGTMKTCITNASCNRTALPLRLVQLLGLKICPTKINVTIANALSYSALGTVQATS